MFMHGRLRNELGQNLIEYAFLLFILSIALVVLLSVIGVDIKEMFDAVENETGDNAVNGDDGLSVPSDDNATVDEARKRPE